MIVFVSVLMIVIGCLIAGITGFVNPLDMIDIGAMRYMPMLAGMCISFSGVMILLSRAKRTGALNLLHTADPDKILWFFIHRDGTVKITPSIRLAQGLLESKSMDYVIHDVKAYKLFDHNIRFVAEGCGHSCDAKMAMYAKFLKTKWGFKSLKDGREQIFNEIEQSSKEVIPDERIEEQVNEEVKQPEPTTTQRGRLRAKLQQ